MNPDMSSAPDNSAPSGIGTGFQPQVSSAVGSKTGVTIAAAGFLGFALFFSNGFRDCFFIGGSATTTAAPLVRMRLRGGDATAGAVVLVGASVGASATSAAARFRDVCFCRFAMASE
ncbi:hypothetical protein BC828DRAFT_168607 [Blastocladiella britannica]|nr:hypothetical protein BC828DRAFT_168607 [Blastocladiella britannica]